MGDVKNDFDGGFQDPGDLEEMGGEEFFDDGGGMMEDFGDGVGFDDFGGGDFGDF